MELEQEKGASSWFTTLSIQVHKLTLHKGAFQDALALYGWQPTHTSTNCSCGTPFSVYYAFSCQKGGSPGFDLMFNAWLMSEVCQMVVLIEPALQSLIGEMVSGAKANWRGSNIVGGKKVIKNK